MKKFLLVFLGLLIFLNIALYGYLRFAKISKKTFWGCPVPNEYCQKGIVLEIKGQYFGIGYTVPVCRSGFEPDGLRYVFSVRINFRKSPSVGSMRCGLPVALMALATSFSPLPVTSTTIFSSERMRPSRSIF